MEDEHVIRMNLNAQLHLHNSLKELTLDSKEKIDQLCEEFGKMAEATLFLASALHVLEDTIRTNSDIESCLPTVQTLANRGMEIAESCQLIKMEYKVEPDQPPNGKAD